MKYHYRMSCGNVAAMNAPTTPARTSPAVILNRTKLDELRRANGIETESDLARIIGVSTETLWRVSNGKTFPSNGFIAGVKIAFPHVSLDSLFEIVPAEALAS